MTTTFQWRRLDAPGEDVARLEKDGDRWVMEGEAKFEENELPCFLRYRVTCRPDWSTQSAEVKGTVAGRAVNVRISADGARHWMVNGAAVLSVSGCLDLDLSFSPATNLLAIRRLALPVGQEAAVRSAWLRFPELDLQPLLQTYRRTDDSTYSYASPTFSGELTVNAEGFVTRYPGLWEDATPLGKISIKGIRPL